MRNALLSVQNQIWQEWVAIVVNDASTVDYSDIVSSFSDDTRIVFLRREKNGGINPARNTGLAELMKYDVDFITFLDDDDEFSSDFFSASAEIIAKHPGYGWYMSNNYGEHKASTRDIQKECEFDWIDDYIYGKIRGDKAHLFSKKVLTGMSFDERFRSSNRWPFFIDVCEKTKIFAYPHPSVKKSYLDGGITKGGSRKLKNLQEVSSKFYKHYYVITKRPGKLAAYKYFLLELIKTPMRIIRLLTTK